jgi:hypothetical protein
MNYELKKYKQFLSTVARSVATRFILTVSLLLKLKLCCDIRPLLPIQRESNFLLIFVHNI